MKYFAYTPGAYNYWRLPNVRLIICTVKNKTREETGKHQYLMSSFKALRWKLYVNTQYYARNKRKVWFQYSVKEIYLNQFRKSKILRSKCRRIFCYFRVICTAATSDGSDVCTDFKIRMQILLQILAKFFPIQKHAGRSFLLRNNCY